MGLLLVSPRRRWQARETLFHGSAVRNRSTIRQTKRETTGVRCAQGACEILAHFAAEGKARGEVVV
jgi:hypothetical protein